MDMGMGMGVGIGMVDEGEGSFGLGLGLGLDAGIDNMDGIAFKGAEADYGPPTTMGAAGDRGTGRVGDGDDANEGGRDPA